MATLIKKLFSDRTRGHERLLAPEQQGTNIPKVDYGLMRHHRVTDEESASTSSTAHLEKHFESPRIVSDAIIGFSDGLCVPFALVSGLASLDSSKVVVLAGFTELISGAISMGMGAWLACQSEIDHYNSERRREELEVMHDPEEEERECLEIFAPYGISPEAMKPMLHELKQDPQLWVDFMVKFELGLESPSIRTALFSGLTVGLSYFIGGFVPLLPYLLIASTLKALYVSIAMTASVLFIFGWAKAYVLAKSKRAALNSALQTLLIGTVAAGSAFGIVRILDANST